MASCWWWMPAFDWDLLAQCRREVKAQMVASGFQIGGKFDEVAERRARKLYRSKTNV